jgi:hypothetical protein
LPVSIGSFVQAGLLSRPPAKIIFALTGLLCCPAARRAYYRQQKKLAVAAAAGRLPTSGEPSCFCRSEIPVLRPRTALDTGRVVVPWLPASYPASTIRETPPSSYVPHGQLPWPIMSSCLRSHPQQAARTSCHPRRSKNSVLSEDKAREN